MRIFLHLLARFKRLKWNEINRLIVLSITLFVLSASVCLWDISATALLLQKEGVTTLGADYLLAALMWFVVAGAGCAVMRHLGFGAARTAVIWVLFLFGLLTMKENAWHLKTHLIFASKYGTLFLMNFLFWLLASRYIKISMASLKFIGLCAVELFGLLLGSFMSCHMRIINALWIALIGLILCGLMMQIICWMFSVQREVFIRKSGGVQDAEDRTIIDLIWALSFFWMIGRLLVEFVLYTYAEQQSMPLMTFFGQIYGFVAGLSLLALICFARTRFLYTMPLGLIICAASVGLCALGSLFNESWMILGGVLCFFISSHFYMNRYLSLLIHPFLPGKGTTIEKVRLMGMIPCAFVLVGALLSQFDLKVLNWVLLADMGILALLFILSGHVYGRQLMKICALKIWREGPFLLAYPPLKQMIRQGLSKTQAAEAIYFLNIVDEGYIFEYRSLLDQMLKHPAISVRLFVLKKLNKFSLTLKEKHLLSAMMKNDSCTEVQNMALACLIRDALETNSVDAWHKYKEYLADKKWILGACCGFLYGRGIWIDKIIETVHRLADSTKEKENMMALTIMTQHPRAEWTDMVDKLLNSASVSVVKMAIVAAGKIAAPALLNRLLTLLDEVRWRDSVLETLQQYGKQAFPSIEKAIVNDIMPMYRQKVLILFLGALPSGEGKQLLLRIVFQTRRVLRQVIIESLGDSGIVWVHKDKKRILQSVIEKTAKEWLDIREMLWQTEILKTPVLHKVKNLFVEALTEELVRTRGLILNQIGFYSLNPLAQQAIAVLKGKDLNAYAAAVGCLQDILPKKIYQQTKNLLLYPTQDARPKNSKKITEQVFLNYFVLNAPGWVSPWVKALALYGWRELHDKEGLKAVEEGLKSADWVVLESALSALGRLEKDRQKTAQLVLNIPTRYLLKQNFETLLEEKHHDHH